MKDSLRYRLAIHSADTPDEVAALVQSYFSLSAPESSLLDEVSPLLALAAMRISLLSYRGI